MLSLLGFAGRDAHCFEKTHRISVLQASRSLKMKRPVERVQYVGQWPMSLAALSLRCAQNEFSSSEIRVGAGDRGEGAR